jgi:hypothetical protein
MLSNWKANWPLPIGEAVLFKKKAERVRSAGARGLVIVNTEDALFAAPAATPGYCAAIPVVMIRAKDAAALLTAANSSCLRPFFETLKVLHLARRPAIPAQVTHAEMVEAQLPDVGDFEGVRGGGALGGVVDGLQQAWKRPVNWAGFLVIGSRTCLPLAAEF